MRWLRHLFERQQIYNDFAEEIQQHLAEKIDALMAEGMSREQAEHAARRDFGNIARIEEAGHEAWMWPRVESLLADLRFALRRLRRSPAFALTAILTLAVGIGANVVTFSVLNGMLLRSIDVPHPQNLFEIGVGPDGNYGQSYLDYLDLRDRNRSFTGMALWKSIHVGISVHKSVAESWGNAATGNYFDMLGLRPTLGRFFHASDEHGRGSAPYIVLAYDYWQRHFAADPHVIGSTVLLNQFPFTVIGVAPQDFHGTSYFFWPDYWIPAANAEQVTGWDDYDWRDHRDFTLLGRLRPGVTPQQATADLNAIAAQMAKHDPRDQGLTMRVRRPGPAGDRNSSMKTTLFCVTFLAALVLLAACSNLAGIFAARAADRSSELAIRLALGAGRWTVVRQLLTETVLLSVIGGIVGTFIARLLLGMLTYYRSDDFPTHYLIAPDFRVYLVAIFLSIASGIFFGILPARQVWRTDVVRAVRSGYAFAGSFRRFAVRDVLLFIQIIVCTLLVGSSLVAVLGMARALRVPLGVNPRGVTLAQLDLKVAGVPDAQSRLVQKRLLDAAAALPGVTAAATSDYVPLSGGATGWAVYHWETTDLLLSHAVFGAITYSVSPGYFQVAGTRLLSGRDFTADDKRGSPIVAIVNETFARRLFGTINVVGQRFKLFDPAGFQIVGVVEDGKYFNPTEESQPAVYIAYAQGIGQYIDSGPVTVLVRSPLPQDQIIRELHHALSQVVTTAPISVQPWSDPVERSLMLVRTATIVLAVLGFMAALLAVTGIFGMASYAVSRRAREQGIRIALGAQRFQVMRAMLARPILILLCGSSLGILGAVFAAGILTHLVSFATTRDPLVLTAVALTMLLLGVIATWVPARRSLAIDPASLLRES